MQSKNRNIFQITAIVGLVLISSLILLQGFHHHHSLVHETNCVWHNLITASILLLIALALHGIFNSTSLVYALHAGPKNKRSIFLTHDLLSLPPPAAK